MNRNKFTLVELIVVIVILSVLAAIVMANVSQFKENAITSMIEGNTRNLQGAVDTYALKNNGKLPSIIQPSFGNPQFVNIDELYPKYLKSKPDYNKLKDQKYWIDAFGRVWGATADSPSPIFESTEYVEWSNNEKATAFNLYEVENSAQSKASVKKYTFSKKVQLEEFADRVRVKRENKTYLISSVDQYGLESAPVGLNYLGYQEDWFSPILNKEGIYDFGIDSFDTMYWLDFKSIQELPEGTSIIFKFAVQKEDGSYTDFTEDFYSLPPSKSMKIKIEMKGANDKNPSLFFFKVFYSFEEDVEKPSATRVVKENVDENGYAIDKYNPVKVVDQFVLIPDMKVKDIVISDSYAPFNPPVVKHTYSTDDEVTFHPIISLTDVPQGSTIRVEREYKTGEGVVVRTPIVEQKKGIQTADGDVSIIDPELNDPQWETVETLRFFASTGDGQKAKWLKAEMVDVKPTDTRILYRYAYSNSSSFSKDRDDISSLPLSESVRVSAYLQVKKGMAGKITNPEVKSIRLFHERGYTDLSLVQPTVAILPEKSNNQNSGLFSTTTKVDWKYEAFDPRGREITDVEWAGDKFEQYSTPGDYKVQVRVKNESGYWSNWATFAFTVKDEYPTAVISRSPSIIEIGAKVNWSYTKSTDPDGDGIVAAEWEGDKKDVYDKTGEYTVRLRVKDAEGNWSFWTDETFNVVENANKIYRLEAEDGVRVRTSGYKEEINLAEASNGKIMHIWGGTSYRTTMYFEFVGTGLDVAMYDPSKMNIVVDGTTLSSNIEKEGFHIESIKNLPLGNHTVSIQNALTSNAGGKIDYIDIYSIDDQPEFSKVATYQINENNQESAVPNNNLIIPNKVRTKTYFTLSKDSDITAKVYDSNGQLIQTILQNTRKTGGTFDTHYVIWDGKDSSGNEVDTGSFTLELTAKGIGKYKKEAKTTAPIYVENEKPVYRIEAEDTNLFTQGGWREVKDFSGASNGKALYSWGATSYSSSHRSSFVGDGIDIALYNPVAVNVLIDGVSQEKITKEGWYIFSRRNLPNGTHTVQINVGAGNGARADIDYIDVYNSNDTVTVSNMKSYNLVNGVKQPIESNVIVPHEGSFSSIDYNLDKNAYVSAVIKNDTGQVVRTIFTNSYKTGGTFSSHNFNWDGKNDNGNTVASGTYLVEIQTKGIKTKTLTTKSISILVDNSTPAIKYEAESSPVSLTKNTGAIAQAREYIGASNNQVAYVEGCSSCSATAKLTFTGTGFDVVMFDLIYTRIYVDDVLVHPTGVDHTGRFVYSKRNLPNGQHSVRIYQLGKTGTKSSVDYFNVYN